MLGVSACCNELALNRLSVKVTFLGRKNKYDSGAIIINSEEMNIYKTDLVKAVCYEAPSMTVFNVVAENGFCDSGSKPSNANSDDPDDFEFGGMFY